MALQVYASGDATISSSEDLVTFKSDAQKLIKLSPIMFGRYVPISEISFLVKGDNISLGSFK
jgi:hypothetical protein